MYDEKKTNEKLKLTGLTQDVLLYMIPFLDAWEISTLTQVSKEFQILCENELLWLTMYEKDFMLGKTITPLETDKSAKNRYISRVTRRKQIVERKIIDRERRELHLKNETNRNWLQSIWNFLHFRLASVLFPISGFTTCLLLGLNYSNVVTYSIWILLLPLWIYYCLAVFLFLSLFYLCSKSNDAGSLYYGMIADLRGPFIILCQEVFEDNVVALTSGLGILVSIVCFTVLLALKLSMLSTLNWLIVFIPIWISIIVILLSPWLRWVFSTEMPGYTIFVIFILLPIGATCTLLCLKLTGWLALTLPYVFFPTWMMDFFFLCIPCTSCVYNLFRRDVEVVDSAIACLCIWGCLIPEIVFKVFICTYEKLGDDAITPLGVPVDKMHDIFALFFIVQIVSPLLILFGSLIVCTWIYTSSSDNTNVNFRWDQQHRINQNIGNSFL